MRNSAEDLVDHPHSGIEQNEDDADHHHRRDELGCVADHLHRFLEEVLADVVERQRQQNWQRKAGDQTVDAQDHRVPDDLPEVVRADEALEVLEPDPWTAGDAVDHVEVAERDLHAVHRPVLEKQQPEQW